MDLQLVLFQLVFGKLTLIAEQKGMVCIDLVQRLQLVDLKLGLPVLQFRQGHLHRFGHFLDQWRATQGMFQIKPDFRNALTHADRRPAQVGIAAQ